MESLEEFLNFSEEKKKEIIKDALLEVGKGKVVHAIASIIKTEETIPNMGKISIIIPILAQIAISIIEKTDNIKSQLETFKKFSVISQDIPSLEMIETIKNLLDEL
jgi:hypothetical protein